MGLKIGDSLSNHVQNELHHCHPKTPQKDFIENHLEKKQFEHKRLQLKGDQSQVTYQSFSEKFSKVVKNDCCVGSVSILEPRKITQPFFESDNNELLIPLPLLSFTQKRG